MSNLKTYVRKKRKQTMGNDVGKHDFWEPETPSKSTSLRQQRVKVEEVRVGFPMKLIPITINQVSEYSSCDQTAGVGSPMKQGGGTNTHSQCDDVEFELPSKKRNVNDKEDTKDKAVKKPRKKTYWPKIDTPSFERTKKSQPKNNTTLKPSTPKQRKSYVRKVVPKCQRSLFAEEDSSNVSFPFLNGSEGSCELENSSMKNEIGIQYSSLQSYQQMTCLFESRQSGENFPRMCKKKRTRRDRLRFEKFFLRPWPIVKGKRSQSFIRKKRNCIDFCSEDNSTITRKMKSIIKRILIIKKKESPKAQKVKAQEKTGGELVPYKPPPGEVILDEDTLKAWAILKEERVHKENDEMKQKHWEEIRKIYTDMVESFITCMHYIQGDRRFLPWKGSVMDSVVGVFLTQNVSDALSSAAYMSLASRFPIKDRRGESKEELVASQESVGSNMVLSNPEFDEVEPGKAEEVEDKEAKGFSDVANKETEKKFESTTKNSDSPTMVLNKEKSTPTKKSVKEALKQETLLEKERYWETLRKIHSKSYRHEDQMDSIDWEAVRCARVHDVAQAIAGRGQHNIIAGRIKTFLDDLMESNGSMDLEWLRDIPPKDAKEYLLNIYGIGLKSVECIRLLALQHCAFPVDVNVGRIVIRLGWVPIQSLPEPMQFHDLEKFPNSDKIQQYLWPRLCTLDPRTLYELHYQMITFGKVFCTKKNPNCNACPMRNGCKHYASVLASKKHVLLEPTSDQGVVVTSMDPTNSSHYSTLQDNFESTFMTEVNKSLIAEASKECEPIIEMPTSPEAENRDLVEFEDDVCEDNIEDIEDFLTINLNQDYLSQTHDYSYEEPSHHANISTSLVAWHADGANIPLPKIKNVSRLKTERLAYVLTENHPLLAEVEHTPLESNDPSPFLFVVWATGELESSCEPSQESPQEELNSQTVPGTLLIPCRSAMRGRFPLNGTYFQVNEVFADYTSMIHPINAPRAWLWKLDKKIVYFGTGASAIMTGMSLKQIHDVFWNGYICLRAIDGKTRAPRPISSILHRSTTSKLEKRVNEE